MFYTLLSYLSPLPGYRIGQKDTTDVLSAVVVLVLVQVVILTDVFAEHSLQREKGRNFKSLGARTRSKLVSKLNLLQK